MIRVIAGRSLESLVVLLLMSLVIYALIGLMPGDPIDLMVQGDPRLTPADAARLKALYGLDRPLLERYGNWLLAALGGEFGYSRLHNQPALAVILPRLGNTCWLMGASFLLSLAIALPIGVWSALRARTGADYAVNLAALAGISLPTFWLALMLITLFAVQLQWLPAGGLQTIGVESVADRARHLVLPVVCLAVTHAGAYTRFMRAAMVEVLRLDFVRAARAKGLSETRVLFAHALPNALAPTVTVVALSFGALFSGALVTETMFAQLGMGKLVYDSIMGNDYNVALVALLLATALTLAANLAADVLYAWLDPRVTFAGRTP
ncbi:MAG: ABC transporter permease [Alphaproteobacteria bacterium]|nr:ABC transporter permease [Alphaproteobacteria bacterium]